MRNIVIDLVGHTHDTGGLLRYTDGKHAPAFSPCDFKLGEIILKATEALESENVHYRLFIDELDISSQEAA